MTNLVVNKCKTYTESIQSMPLNDEKEDISKLLTASSEAELDSLLDNEPTGIDLRTRMVKIVNMKLYEAQSNREPVEIFLYSSLLQLVHTQNTDTIKDVFNPEYIYNPVNVVSVFNSIHDKEKP